MLAVIFYFEKLSRHNFTKTTHKLAFGPSKSFYRSDFEDSILVQRYSFFTLAFTLRQYGYIR